jgi:tetratricopeptide (TPR) repeat protein
LQANCALLSGRYEYAKKTALQLRAAIDTSLLSMAPPMGSYVQYLYMTPLFIDVRYGKWNDLLKMPAPAAHHTYANVLYHFSKGMAYAAIKDFSGAENEKRQMQILIQDNGLSIAIKPFSPAIEGAKCAEEMLAGFISYNQNNFTDAITHLQKATEIESNMVYNEPRDWMVSPKQYLGAAYFAAGKYNNAQKMFESDLKVNADNVWSLFGLQQSLLKKKKQVEAAKIKSRLKKATAKSDTNPAIML